MFSRSLIGTQRTHRDVKARHAITQATHSPTCASIKYDRQPRTELVRQRCKTLYKSAAIISKTRPPKALRFGVTSNAGATTFSKGDTSMSLLVTLILLVVVLNIAGSFTVPTYRNSPYYAPGWGGIVALVILLYFLGYIHIH
jgi:hypothetical protein